MAAYIKNSANGARTDTGSTLITASKLNAKAGSDYGYVVKLGGLDWMITSLTVANINGTEQPIMTLMLAIGLTKPDNTALTTQYYNDNSNTKGNNMYSRSILRYNINKKTGDFAKLALFNKEDASKNAAFEAQFLVQPKNIPYQLNQTQVGRTDNLKDSKNNAYHFANEALTAPSSGWSSASYSNSDRYNDPNGVSQSYNAWGNDYIWMPSVTETGWTDYLQTSCIWQLSDSQRVTNGLTWLRSGLYNNYGHAYLHGSGGSMSSNSFLGINKVRPALHLNLAEVVKLVAQDTELTYTGNTPDYSKEAWYCDGVLGNSSICTIQYTDNETNLTLASAPTAAGEYTVTFTLKGDDYIWDGSSTSKKREITLTIKPKKLSVDFSVDPDTQTPTLVLDGTPISGDTVNCVIRYFDKAKDDATRQDLGTDISKLSSKTWYYAVAEFDDPNYEPDLEDEDKELRFFNPAKRVSVTWKKGEGKKSYTGNVLTFHLDFNKELVDVAAGEGVTYDTYDGFKATNVGTYSVTLSLKDTQNYVWVWRWERRLERLPIPRSSLKSYPKNLF